MKALDPAKNLYRVTLVRRDGPKVTQVCTLQGDEWDVSARVQKWKPWANVLGLDATYTLDQMSNRYFTAARGNGKPITSCDLKGPPPAVGAWVRGPWLHWLADHAYTEDWRFGSASFMPLADGATYRVLITQSGLNAEPANDIRALCQRRSASERWWLFTARARGLMPSKACRDLGRTYVPSEESASSVPAQ